MLHFLLQIINSNACNQINGLPPTRFVLEILITSEQSHNFPDVLNGINKAKKNHKTSFFFFFQVNWYLVTHYKVMDKYMSIHDVLNVRCSSCWILVTRIFTNHSRTYFFPIRLEKENLESKIRALLIEKPAWISYEEYVINLTADFTQDIMQDDI